MKKNKKNDRRVLAAALVVAGVTVAGSTFAWFTSKDEVTNRLSASASYNVSVAEDFTPPEDWTPGQTVKKEAKAINTGNVDAFVRMWLTGDMKLVKEDAGVAALPTTLEAVTAQPYAGLKLTKKDGNDNYYRILTDDERKALQTGELAYAGGAYKIDDVPGAAFTTGQGAVELINSKNFTPTEAGLYIFRRNYDIDSATGDIKPATAQFSGYYFDEENYYALKTANISTVAGGVPEKGSNVYIKELAGKTGAAFTDAIGKVKIYTAKETTLANSALTWEYKEPASAEASPFGTVNPYFVVSETGADSSLKINIELDNIGDGSAADKWQKIGDTTFYYTDDVEAGETTNILVKSVQLDSGVTQDAYLAFDFDLNVNLESIQVTKDNDGKETTDSVQGANWAATADSGATGATGEATAAEDLAKVKWTAKA